MDVYESDRALEKRSKIGTTRQPLLPAENKNGSVRRSRIREVSSRYMSPTPSATTIPKRCQSPIPARTSSTSVLSTTKRALSAERKRPSRPSSPKSPSPATPVQDTSAEALLASRKIAGNKLPESLWPSTMRSLSVSFQSDVPVTVSTREKRVSHTPDRTLRPSSSNPATKQVENSLSRKPTPERNRSPLKTDQSENSKPLNSLSRKPTPERKRSPLKVGQSENSKPVDSLHSRLHDQHRWPSKATGKVSPSFPNKSVDLSDKGSKIQSFVPSRPSTPSLRRLSLDGATKPLQKSSSDLLMQLSSDDSSVRLRKAGSLASSDRTSLLNATANKSVDLSEKGSKIQSLVSSRPSTPSLRRLSLDGATKPLQKSSSDFSDDSSVRLRKAGSLVSSDRTSFVNAAANKSVDLSDKGSKIQSLVSSRPSTPSLRRLSLDGATKPLQKSSSDLLMELPSDDSSIRLRKAGSLVSSDRTSFANAASNKSVDLSDKGSKIQSLVPSRPSTPSLRRLSLDGATKPLQKSSTDLLMQLSIDDSSVRLRKAGSLVSSDRTSLVSAAAKSLSVSSPVSRPVSPSVSRWLSPLRLRPNPSSRGPSPARARPSSPSRQTQSSNSVLSFIADIKGKKASNHIEDVHQLRLLYNRHLQWCYANAQTYAALNLQKAKAEKILYNVWTAIVNLRGSVTVKKTDLQRLKVQLQLSSVLNNQLTCLDEWASIERDHTNSVTSVIQDLQASTIRIPVTGGAKGDIETVKAAICSAVDVMQAMGSSLRSVLSRVEAMNTLVSELADVAAHERATLIECELVLGSTTALQVQENSLRTHLLQMKEAYGESSSMFGY